MRSEGALRTAPAGSQPRGCPRLVLAATGVFAHLPAPDRPDPDEPGQVDVAAVDAGRDPGGVDAEDIRHVAGGQTRFSRSMSSLLQADSNSG